jgi:hypothetical protein
MMWVTVGGHRVTFADRTIEFNDDGDPVSTLSPRGHAEIFLQACAANGIEAEGVFVDTSTNPPSHPIRQGLRAVPDEA